MTQAIPAASASDAQRCEVLVVGGGPAGATMAALLARQGRQVVLLEKDHHPRFHIGESLLPANVKLLEEMGLREQVEAIGLPKWGVEFVSPDHQHQVFVEFAEAWDKSMPMAWQVRRADFDQILFRHAAANGALTIEGCKVRKVDFDADGATVESVLDDGAVRRWSAKFVVDASGRDTLLAKQFELKQKNPAHNSAALFGHFSGARRLEGQREGNISIFWFAHGWFWFIPLADGTTSVGAVCWPHYLKTRDKPLDEFFADTLALCPRLGERLRDAHLVDGKVYATGNYSYGSSRSSGERYLLLGDAYAFIDPVFSSGVYLAMASAFAGVEVVAATLDRPREAPSARRRFERHMRKGPSDFSWFIFRMTNPAMRDLFMYPRNTLRVKEAVLALLAGDIFGCSRYQWRLRLFKGIYYIGSMINLPRTLRALRLRRDNIRDVGALEGENVVAPAK